MSEDRITHQKPYLLLTWSSVERDANVMYRRKVWGDHVFGPVTTELYSFTSSTLLSINTFGTNNITGNTASKKYAIILIISAGSRFLLWNLALLPRGLSTVPSLLSPHADA